MAYLKTFTYPDSIERKIGFDTVRSMISDLCLSEGGRDKCSDMAFSADFETVTRKLRHAAEMCAIFSADEEFPLNSVFDLTPQLRAIRAAGTHMPQSELLRLLNSLGTLMDIAAFFHRGDSESEPLYPELSLLASEIDNHEPVIKYLERIIDRFGNIRDNASPALSQIRSAMASMGSVINSAMRRVMAAAVRDGLIDADTAPSVRDGRLVIPVAPMHKRKIQGIVHDESASGKTIFIEPSEVVEANNRMRQLQIEEKHEIIRILTEVADMLRPRLPQLLASYDILAAFDFIQAKARFARLTGGTMPNLHSEPQMEWYHACHPGLMLALQRQGKEIVPLDIRLTETDHMLLISGPNAGGKSVVLKTVAVVQYMTQCGVLPPVYDNSHVGIFSGIFIDIGDDQSIEDDLSTYSSHLRNMKFLLAHGNENSLALIDEFGSGTEPQIGGALAQAMLMQMVEQKIWGVITTHFQNLKHLAEDTPGLINGSMLYDRQKMQPLFRLTIGLPGSSFAVEIARNIGLPSAIISRAEEIVGSDYINLDKYLLDIARDRRYWENKRMQIRQKEKKIDDIIERYDADAETLRQKRREIIEDAREEARKILDRSNAAVEKTISDIRRAQADREKTLEARKELAQLKQRMQQDDVSDSHPLLQKKHKKQKRDNKQQPKKQAELKVGDNVLLDGSGTVGSILEINGTNAVVAFGLLKTSVALSRLVPTIKKVDTGARKAVSFISAATADAARERQLNFRQEIDVRGMRVDEAVQAVTYFIDDAVQFGAGRVRILHGTGTGALRQYIRDYLKTVPAVVSFGDEDVRFGGAGITVVNLS